MEEIHPANVHGGAPYEIVRVHDRAWPSPLARVMADVFAADGSINPAWHKRLVWKQRFAAIRRWPVRITIGIGCFPHTQRRLRRCEQRQRNLQYQFDLLYREVRELRQAEEAKR